VARVEHTRTTPEVSMRSLTIGALLFFNALLAETMLEPSQPSTTSVREAHEAGVRKKNEIKKPKKTKQQGQARPRNATLPPNLGPGIGLGL
jgi:hypothetical protein